MDRRETESPGEADYTAAVPLEIDEETATRADDLLREFAEDAGLETALIVDRSGSLVAGISAEADVTVEVISALVAGASGAMRALVSRLGETGAVESLHLGGDRLVYLREIVNRFILVAVAEVSRPAGLVRQKALSIGPRLDDLLREIRSQEPSPPPPHPARSLRAIARERAALREAGIAVVPVTMMPAAQPGEDRIKVEEREAIQVEEMVVAEFPEEVPVEESFETLEFPEDVEATNEVAPLPVAETLEASAEEIAENPPGLEDKPCDEEEGGTISPFEAFEEEFGEEVETDPGPEPVPKEILEPIDFGEPEIVVECSLPSSEVRSPVMPLPVDSPFEAEEDEIDETAITPGPGAFADVFEVEEDEYEYEEEEVEAGEASVLIPPLPPEPHQPVLEEIIEEESIEESSLPEARFEELMKPIGEKGAATTFSNNAAPRSAFLFEMAGDDDLEDDFDEIARGDEDDDLEALQTANVFEVDLELDEDVDLLEDDPFEEGDPAESFAASAHLATPSEPELSPEAGHPFADEIEEMIAEEEEESEIRSSGPFYF